jgi:putative addiction module component (TIGR02574 family)
MAVSMKDLGIDQLSVDDRLALVGEIWNSITIESPRLPLSEATIQELKRREAEHLANPDDVISWEQVRDEALARLKQ